MQLEQLLIEIGCEDLPSRYVESLSNALFNIWADLVQQNEIEIKDLNIFATPRRLAMSCQIASYMPEKNVVKQGPWLEHCLDQNNAPNAAANGFAKSCGVSFDALDKVEVNGKYRLQYTIKTSKVKVDELIVELLNQACKQLRGFKMMRWADLSLEFPRPVHWVMMKLGDKNLTGEVLNCKLQGFTYGHRFMSPVKIDIETPSDYVKLMQQHYVSVDINTRQQTIVRQIQKIIPSNLTLVADEELLKEVNGLIEWPGAVLCEFDSRFLKLPEELLIEVMRVHQKCFSIKNILTNELAPYFITIANIVSKDIDRVKQGNQRVMTARLSDAEFFFLADQKVKLATMVEKLADVSFHSGLGSMLDKSFRVQSLAEQIANSIAIENSKAISLIAKFAKADLCSETVGEFPKLHAVVGAKLAKLESFDQAVVTGINQQVLPRHSDDNLPSTIEAQIVAIADRIDTLVGFFTIQCAPTGDKDPFGLRRAAMAVVRIILEKNLVINLTDLIKMSQATYSGSVLAADQIRQLIKFLQERFKVFWELNHTNKAIFLAVPCHDADFYSAYQKMLFLQQQIDTIQGKELLQVNKRMVNFLKHHCQDDLTNVDNSLFVSDKEHDLYDRLASINEFAKLSLKDQFTCLYELTPLLNNLFDNCLILDESTAIKNNRLALLNNIDKLFSNVANFSKLSA